MNLRTSRRRTSLTVSALALLVSVGCSTRNCDECCDCGPVSYGHTAPYESTPAPDAPASDDGADAPMDLPEGEADDVPAGTPDAAPQPAAESAEAVSPTSFELPSIEAPPLP